MGLNTRHGREGRVGDGRVRAGKWLVMVGNGTVISSSKEWNIMGMAQCMVSGGRGWDNMGIE